MKLFRQLSCVTAGEQKAFEAEQMVLQHYLMQHYQVSFACSDKLAAFIASVHSYRLSHAIKNMQENPAVLLGFIRRYISTDIYSQNQYHADLSKPIRAELFHIISQESSPTPSVTALFHRENKKIPSVTDLYDGLNAVLNHHLLERGSAEPNMGSMLPI